MRLSGRFKNQLIKARRVEMKKYVVLIEREIWEGHVDETIYGIFDTQEEAEAKTVDALDNVVDEDKEKTEKCVGEISEKKLSTPGEWESFTDIEIISQTSASDD